MRVSVHNATMIYELAKNTIIAEALTFTEQRPTTWYKKRNLEMTTNKSKTETGFASWHYFQADIVSSIW